MGVTFIHIYQLRNSDDDDDDDDEYFERLSNHQFSVGEHSSSLS